RGRPLERRGVGVNWGHRGGVGENGWMGTRARELPDPPLDLLQPLQHPTPEPPPVRRARRPLGPRGGAALAVPPIEPLDATGRVDQLLLAREERMARRADLDVDRRDGRPRLGGVPAGAHDPGLLVLGVDAVLQGGRGYSPGSGPRQRVRGMRSVGEEGPARGLAVDQRVRLIEETPDGPRHGRKEGEAGRAGPGVRGGDQLHLAAVFTSLLVEARTDAPMRRRLRGAAAGGWEGSRQGGRWGDWSGVRVPHSRTP